MKHKLPGGKILNHTEHWNISWAIGLSDHALSGQNCPQSHKSSVSKSRWSWGFPVPFGLSDHGPLVLQLPRWRGEIVSYRSPLIRCPVGLSPPIHHVKRERVLWPPQMVCGSHSKWKVITLGGFNGTRLLLFFLQVKSLTSFGNKDIPLTRKAASLPPKMELRSTAAVRIIGRSFARNQQRFLQWKVKSLGNISEIRFINWNNKKN